MKPLFTAEDFKTVFSPPMGDDDLEYIADRANAKLEREGKRVWVCDGELKTLHFAQPVDATHESIILPPWKIEKEESNGT